MKTKRSIDTHAGLGWSACAALFAGSAMLLVSCHGAQQEGPIETDGLLAELLFDGPLPDGMQPDGAPPRDPPPPRFCREDDIFFPFPVGMPVPVAGFGGGLVTTASGPTTTPTAPPPTSAPPPPIIAPPRPVPPTSPTPTPTPPLPPRPPVPPTPGAGAGGSPGFPPMPMAGSGSFDDDDAGFPMGGTGGFPMGGTGGPMGGNGGFPMPPDPSCEGTPIGFWEFNSCRRQRTDLFDSSFEDHMAFRSVDLQCAEGREGQAVSFERQGDLVHVPDQPAFALDQGVTVAAWVKPDSVRGVRTIVRKRDEATSAFALIVRNGRFMFVVQLKSGRLAAVSAPATAGEWTHVAATYDNSYLRLYIDGSEVRSKVASGSLSEGVGPLLIGNDASGRRFDGLIDNVWFNTLAAPARKIMELTCVRRPFEMVLSPEVGPPSAAGSFVPFELTITNVNDASCPATAYAASPSLPQGFTADPGFTTTEPVASGESVTLTFEIASGEEAEPDDHPFEIFAFTQRDGLSNSVQGTFVITPPEGCHVRSSRELTIRHTSVVDDPIRTSMNGGDPDDPRTGAWSFGHLMQQLSPSDDLGADVTEEMFTSFATPQTVNGFVIEARPAIDSLLLDEWPRTADGKLDLSQSPLTLLAIVNRFDINDRTEGEGRFVYGVMGPGGFPMEFTVILEYKLPFETDEERDQWAHDFHALQELPFPSEEYNAALQGITERFTSRGSLPGAPNDSALIDIRTNEIALSFQWQLREFRFSEDSGFLVPATVFQTPDFSFNGTETLARWINENEEAILSETHDAPLLFEGAPFKGASVFNNIDFWFAPGINNPEARHKFSLNTCNGCHGAETNTGFLMIHNRFPGQESFLSPFQTGTTVSDPITGESRRLAEFARRRAFMEDVVCADEE